MADENRALSVLVSGRVQGVGFRDWTRRQAIQLGLTGWVRNEADGSVAALIAGSDADVSAMLERFREGPPFATVTSVKTEAAVITVIPSDFRITR